MPDFAYHKITKATADQLQLVWAADRGCWLGVTLTPDLRWNNHVHSMRNKSSATMRLLQRNMRISSTQIKTRAYNTYVRPQLEYAATIWDPHTKQNINKLEQEQRTAARWTLGRYWNTWSVSDMLNELGWRSLEQIRKFLAWVKIQWKPFRMTINQDN